MRVAYDLTKSENHPGSDMFNTFFHERVNRSSWSVSQAGSDRRMSLLYLRTVWLGHPTDNVS